MTNRFVKFAAAVAPAALLLAAAPADAKVLVMGDGGWEVSFDGEVNGFAVWNSSDNAPATPAGFTRVGSVGTPGPNPDGTVSDAFRVRTGLLPAIWAINVKAPTTGGLDMAGRIGIYPNISNNVKNSFGSTPLNQLDLREIFFTVDGSWGQVLVGKTLSQFMGTNLLIEQTLFGIGATGAVTHSAGTTLGRIGFGYVYPQFNARIQYTTPDMNGFKVSAGIYDPSVINGTGNVSAFGGLGLSANKTDSPRFEGEATWAGSLMGTTDKLWISGMWQSAEFTGRSLTGTCTTAANSVATAANQLRCLNGKSVDAWGFTGGVSVDIPVGPGTLGLMGSGYTGQALGTTLQLDVDSLDFTGKEKSNFGFIGQASYAFGQGTRIGFSYGESNQDETAAENSCRTSGGVNSGTQFACAGAGILVKRQSLYDIQLSHDVNPNLKLVAEYGRQSSDWFDSASLDTDIFGVGAFFSW